MRQANETGFTRHEAGSVLVLVFLFLVVFFAMATLTVDMGLALLTQQQMEVGAEGAVLEGLRYRDDAMHGNGSKSPDERDALRRQKARSFASWAFDDDMDPGNGDALNVGAGPVIAFAGGIGSFGASATLQIPAKPVHDPDVQPNEDNLKHGDLVAGDYEPFALAHDESAQYDRTDFDPAAAPDSIDADSFLLRLRRTRNALGLDDAPGIASTGPTLPFIFGRGSLIHAAGSGYDPRTDGLTLRGTAIATADSRIARAVYVSNAPQPTQVQFRQILPFGMIYTASGADPRWDGVGVQNAATLDTDLEASELLTVGGVEWGVFLNFPRNVAGFEAKPKIGKFSDLQDTVGPSLLPIYRVAGGKRIFIGFGHASYKLVEDGAKIELTKLPSIIETRASALHHEARGRIADDPVLSNAHYAFKEPVLAPVLGR